jgi:hypothetical protein
MPFAKIKPPEASPVGPSEGFWGKPKYNAKFEVSIDKKIQGIHFSRRAHIKMQSILILKLRHET